MVKLCIRWDTNVEKTHSIPIRIRWNQPLSHMNLISVLLKILNIHRACGFTYNWINVSDCVIIIMLNEYGTKCHSTDSPLLRNLYVFVTRILNHKKVVLYLESLPHEITCVCVLCYIPMDCELLWEYTIWIQFLPFVHCFQVQWCTFVITIQWIV